MDGQPLYKEKYYESFYDDNLEFFLIILLSINVFAGQDEQEKDIPLSEVPEVVMTDTQNAVKGIEINEAEIETTEDGIVYELEGTVEDKIYEIEVTPDGKIVAVEEEGDEDQDEATNDDDDD